MREHYSHLSLSERRRIDEMVQASIPVREIAAQLGRYHRTIHREITPNFYHTSFRYAAVPILTDYKRRRLKRQG